MISLSSPNDSIPLVIDSSNLINSLLNTFSLFSSFEIKFHPLVPTIILFSNSKALLYKKSIFLNSFLSKNSFNFYKLFHQ